MKYNYTDNSLFVIAGPCVIESRDHILFMAEKLKAITEKLAVTLVFKSSYDKANRSSLNSYRGPGLDLGLKILGEVKKEFDLPVLTDIHNPSEARKVAEVADIIQIPAFLSRQTDLILEAAKTGKIVNIKKGQYLSPWDMKNVINKIEEMGCNNIILTERGTSFGYNNLVNDMRAIPIMKEYEYPVVFDGTHSVQKPGGLGDVSGGERKFVLPLSCAAVAAGCDGLFWEVHDNPDQALSDGPNMIELINFEEHLTKVKSIFDVLNKE